jgi:hypothetical protein
MKPNLFRSIYDSLGEQFPLLPRVRRSFIGLLLFCILFFSIGFWNGNGITIPVKPVENGRFANQSIATYATGTVTLSGYFTITNPGVTEKILLPNQTTDVDLFTLLFLAIVSVIVILVTPKLFQQNLFRKDISNSIRLLGYLTIFHSTANILRTSYYAPLTIESLTNNEFTTHRGFPITSYAELYFALALIALAGVYKRGIKLQEEQDLTV